MRNAVVTVGGAKSPVPVGRGDQIPSSRPESACRVCWQGSGAADRPQEIQVS